MAYSSFGNPAMGSPGPAAAAGTVQNGPGLEDIQQEALGFLALSGEAKVQLLPTPWPADQLPPPTSSLMSVASHKGLVAAAGPDVVIVATTESVRKAFEGPDSGDGHLRAFQPQLKLPMPMRISQLAFSADETYLVLSAENGGGLAVYEVQALLQGSTQSAFELSTNGQALRALTPNPTQDELFAVVTVDGNLMMANLKERSFTSGPSGQLLKTGVSCVSWSTKGKQLVAGLGNGTVYQMTPQGEGKGEIPNPPNTNNGEYVSSITWLENHVFLVVHTPSSSDNGMAQSSSFHIVTRQPPANFMFQKITEPAGPFGLNRSPPHHFMLRLKDFPPNLQDMVIVASSSSTDIGLFTRSKAPLTNNKPTDRVSGVFTMTEMSSDSRRAQLPITADLTDTSPIGLALDLSSKEKVMKPIPGDEIDESPYPVPALMVLNNEGVLASWWVIYSDSIRQNTIYPGLVAAKGTVQAPHALPAPAQAFGGATQPTFGSSNFGAPSTSSAFGATSLPGPSAGTFGAPSGLGQKKSLWGTPTNSSAAPSTVATFGSTPGAASSTPSGGAFGSPSYDTTPSAPSSTTAFGNTPAFGSSSSLAFGSSGLPGKAPSPWTTAGSAAPAFGQAGGLGKTASAFGAPAASSSTAIPSSGGFASFASGGGFAAAAANPSAGGNIFGAKPASNPFGAPSASHSTGTASSFGGILNNIESKPVNSFGVPSTNSSMGTGSPFGGVLNKTDSPSANPFASKGNFVLGSSFKADPSAKDDAPVPLNEAKSSFFGGAFGNALGEAAKKPSAPASVSKEIDLNPTDDISTSEEHPKTISTTPAATPAPARSVLTPPTPTPSALVSAPSTSSAATIKPTASAGFSFGQHVEKPKLGSFSFSNLNDKSDQPGPKTPTPTGTQPLVTSAKTPTSPKIKEEPIPETPGLSKTQEAPLPPDSTSKTSYTAGDTSSSSVGTDAPLPPDFISTSTPKPAQAPPSPPPIKPITTEMIPPSDVPGGPEDDGDDSGFLTEEDDRGEEEEGEEEESNEPSEEGSGEDVANDLSPTCETNQILGSTPESSFGGPHSTTPEGNGFMNIPKLGHGNQRPLFGEIGKSVPVLAPPKAQKSPRSPSPVRSALPGRMIRPETSRSVSAPSAASQILGAKRILGKTPMSSKITYGLSQQEQKAEESRRAEAKARKEAEETQALVDDEDEQYQKFLASEITATTTLDEFVAHSDYVRDGSGDSIPAQVETVYRDINSMIDTLGTNSRSLKGFVKGHTELYKEQGRTREDLENDEDWCLVEIENLSSLLEKDLTRDLESGRVKEVANKLETCNDLQKDITRLSTKHEDIKKIIESHRDSNQLAAARAQPLSAEQAAQQNDLRRDFMKFQTLLSEAEEGLTILKAAIVSQATGSKNPNRSTGPTVEAVMRTITKMTTMAEKRSADIDVLEGQMRRLRFSSTTGVGSREGSPFATPKNNRSSVRNPGTSSTYGLFYTPDSIKDSRRDFRSSLMSSTSPYTISSPPRKKLSGYNAEEKARLKNKLARKKEVTDRLKAALQKSGTIVRLMDDDV